LADDFFGEGGFFFFVVAAAARAFFFGSATFDLPLAEGATASAAGLLSTDAFGFLGTVVCWVMFSDRIPQAAAAQADFAKRRLRNAPECA